MTFQTESFSDLRSTAPDPATLVTEDSGLPISGELANVKFRAAPYASFDFAFGVEKDNWTAEIALQNAFDDRSQRAIYAECTTQICGNEPYIVPSRPRTIALRFGERF